MRLNYRELLLSDIRLELSKQQTEDIKSVIEKVLRDTGREIIPEVVEDLFKTLNAE